MKYLFMTLLHFYGISRFLWHRRSPQIKVRLWWVFCHSWSQAWSNSTSWTRSVLRGQFSRKRHSKLITVGEKRKNTRWGENDRKKRPLVRYRSFRVKVKRNKRLVAIIKFLHSSDKFWKILEITANFNKILLQFKILISKKPFQCFRRLSSFSGSVKIHTLGTLFCPKNARSGVKKIDHHSINCRNYEAAYYQTLERPWFRKLFKNMKKLLIF